jgi:hypothetical protein
MPLTTRRQQLPRDSFDRRQWDLFLGFSSSFPPVEELKAKKQIVLESLARINCDFARHLRGF